MSIEPTNENYSLFWTRRIFCWVWKIFLAKLCNLSFQTPYHTYVYDHYNLQNKPYEKQNRCKKLPHLKNRITKPRIIATKLQPFSPPQFSKWAAYLKSRGKSDFFKKIFFPCNFVKKYPKDLGWCAIGTGHIRPSMGLVLSQDLTQNVRFLIFLAQNQESERSIVGPIWPGAIAL